METPLVDPANIFFALTLSSHRKWGTVLVPCIIKPSANRKFFEIYTTITTASDPDTLSVLTPEECELVTIINKYNEHNLFKVFSRHKNIKEFIELVTDEVIADKIRPYIEKQLYLSLEIAKNEGIPLFHKIRTGQTLHFEDRLSIPDETAKPVFLFSRGEDYSHYNLSIEYLDKRIKILKTDTEVLTNSPCTVRVGSDILFIPGIDGMKLRPFIKNETISIPKTSEKKYYNSFVKGVVNKYRVIAEGFSIIGINPVKQAHLTIEIGIKGVPVAILKFKYGSHSIFQNDVVGQFTDFSSENNNFQFKIIKRDPQWESKCVAILEDAGLVADDGINYSLETNIDDKKRALLALIETIAENHKALDDNMFILETGSLDIPYSLIHPELEMSHSVENDWFDLKAIVKIGDYSFPFSLLRKNIITGVREYKLPDGKYAVLPEEWFTRYKGLMEMGEIRDNDIRLHKQHFSIFQETIEQADNELSAKLERLYIPEKLPAVAIPTNFRANLRSYQKEGFYWLHFLGENKLGGCLADDMGLGKTLQVLALFQWKKENGGKQRPTNLVVVPASLVHNWSNEIKRFCPDLKVLVHKGTSRTKTNTLFKIYDVVISTYHIVRMDAELLCGFKFDTIILDESQYIKNPSSMIYKAVTKLNGANRFVLSGTPVENSLMDLWSQLNFVNPGLLGSPTFFKREYVTSIENWGDQVKEQLLKRIIKPFIMRRTKEMVETELPPVTEHTILCDMVDEQSSIYEKEKSAVRNSIMESYSNEGTTNTAIVVLQGMTKLRQIANHPLLVDESYPFGSGKFERIKDDIQNIISEEHKILIFSSFVKHLNIISTWLEKKNIGFSMLTGSTSNREEVVAEFQKEGSKRVFLISLKAGGTGLNLTRADYVMILDPWWNPATEMQALSRAHRIGQDKSVFVYRYISEGTIEEKIQRLQEKKSKLTETFITLNNPLASLDKETIMEIIG